MRTSSARLAALGVAVMLSALAGCGSGTYSREATPTPPPVDLSGLGALVTAWDADLGEEGVPLDRDGLEAALRADAELHDALLGAGAGS